MSEAREGFNLRNRYGRANFWRRKKWSDVPWRYVWTDTFMPLYCRVVGHVEYDCSDPGHSGEKFACRRCNQFTRTYYQPRPDDGAKYPQAGTM